MLVFVKVYRYSSYLLQALLHGEEEQERIAQESKVIQNEKNKRLQHELEEIKKMSDAMNESNLSAHEDVEQNMQVDQNQAKEEEGDPLDLSQKV